MIEEKMATGCVHIHIKNGDVMNVFTHLSNLPESGVIHLVAEEVLTEEQFLDSHPQYKDELKMKPEKRIFNLGDDSIQVE